MQASLRSWCTSPAQDLKRLTTETPALYADFYTLTYENTHTLLRIIANLAIPSNQKRLADRLLMDLNARGAEEGWIAISQPELASLTAMSLPTLRRVLRHFAASGIITQHYGTIHVHDRKALLKICRS